MLKPPITAHFIRILPLEWHNHISLRIEIYGCPGIPKYFQTVVTVTRNVHIKPLVNPPGLHRPSTAVFFSFFINTSLYWGKSLNFVRLKSCDIWTNRHVIKRNNVAAPLVDCVQIITINSDKYCLRSSAEILVLDPQWTQQITGSAFWISLQPDWRSQQTKQRPFLLASRGKYSNLGAQLEVLNKDFGAFCRRS